MKTKAYFNWSSGKDSALALYRALNRFDIKALLTVIDSTNNRIPMHGTNLDLLKAQSQSIGIPLVTCDINTEYSEDKYKISLQEIIDKFKSQEISTALFGDIHLLELKIGREEKCRQAGLKTDFPLWNNSPQELLHEFIDSGFKAIITCVDGSVLDKTYNPHFQISIESQTKRLNFEPFGKTKCSKIDKHTAQKNVEKTRFFETVC